MTVAEWLRNWLRKPAGDLEIAAAHSLNVLRDELIMATVRKKWTSEEVSMRTGLTYEQHRKLILNIHHSDIMAVSILAESLGMRLYVAPIEKP